jgi:cell division protein FtsI/penicillin-binding protein 2
LLLDARTGEMVAEHWPDARQPVPVGSLIKPFTAYFYAQGHGEFPTVVCHGRGDACWLPRGHGRIGLERAIADSCNAYFLALGRGMALEEANRMLAMYAFPPVNEKDKARALAGLDDNWRVAPVTIARAYLKLIRESRRGARAAEDEAILRGMEDSARVGTAREVESRYPVLAKTGTSACTHAPRASADGFTAVMYPADDPRLLLLVRRHGTTGAATAKLAGEMLRALEAGQQ